MEQIINSDGSSNKDGNNLLIRDGDTATFAEYVIQASMEVPVIVDFWAPWCGPCKQLGPNIEKVVTSASGAVKLVKINVDENQQLAAQLRVQSIPTVYAFVDGQPVDGFVGALPESQIKAFVERLAGEIPASQTDATIEQAKLLLEGGDAASAERIFDEIVKLEPENLDGLAGLVKCFLAMGELDKARKALEGVGGEQKAHEGIRSVEAALKLAEESIEVGDLDQLRARLSADPDHHQTRFDLSQALMAADKYEDAVNELLEIIRRDRNWNEEGARKQLLTVFEACGSDSEVTLRGRRQLSALLFS